MPSLQALSEFKSSFQKLGDELHILNELKLPLDELSLPEHEPAVIAEDSSASEPDMGMDDELDRIFSEASDEPSAEADFFPDLSDLLGGMDNPLPEETEPFGQQEMDSDFFAETAEQEDSNFRDFIDTIPDYITEPESPSEPPISESLPESMLLESLSESLEEESEEEIEETAELMEPIESDDAPLNLADLGLSGLDEIPDDFGITESGSEPQPELDSPPEFLDMGLPGLEMMEQEFTDQVFADQTPGDFDLGALPDFDPNASFDPDIIPDITPDDSDADFDDFAAPEPGEDSDQIVLPDFDSDVSFDPGASIDDLTDADQDLGAFDLGTLPGFGPDAGADFPAEEVLLAEENGEEAMDLSFPGDSEGISAFEEAGDDGFALDLGDFDSETLLEEIPGDSFDAFNPDLSDFADDFGFGAETAGGDSFDGLEEFVIPGIDSESRAAAPKKDVNGKSVNGDTAEVEDINLTSKELEQLLTTLSTYPLNLRIACQELIAEQLVAPEQLSRLVKQLVDGAPAKDSAALAGKIMGRTISIPQGYEKKTGEELEAEQASFTYIFVHKFLPVFRLFLAISLVLASAGYLYWQFIHTPRRADRIYRLGMEQIEAGNFARANERFWQAFAIHPRVYWFYAYARAFTEARQFTLAAQKYQNLLYFTASRNRRGIPDKEAVLEFANLATNYMGDFETADRLIRHNILDFSPLDREALIALGDNNLAWGEFDPTRFEYAREAYARVIERYGRSDPMLERMLKFFIRTDNLEHVLLLQQHFMASPRRRISAETLAEMGGYFLDKRMETVRGVPNEFLDSIGGIRDVLLRAIHQDPLLPEAYFHLARYYNYFRNIHDEGYMLELAIRVFDHAEEGGRRRIGYHINALRRYAEILISRREFFAAEEHLIRAVNIYQSALNRRILTRSPEFGRLFADLGDLEYFVKDGDMRRALEYYRLAEQHGWAPPEMHFRMGAAYYSLRQWGPALDRLFTAHRESPPNRRILHALGNVSFMRGNYFAAQGYFDRLLEMLEADRSRLPPITPTDDIRVLELAERIMVAQNNLGVTLEALAERTGNSRHRFRAQALYTDSARAWDIVTRNPHTMIRMRPAPDIIAPGVNPAFLNVQNNLHPVPGFQPFFFMRIDKDMFDDSIWEELAPPGFRLSEGIELSR